MAPPVTGFAYGMASEAAHTAYGLGNRAYSMIRGRGRMLAPMARMGGKMGQLNPGIQSRLIGASIAAGVISAALTYNPRYRAAVSNGNLEIKTPAMLDATGDLTLSLNRNARGVPSPTSYGYMTPSSFTGSGR
jgi:hypothetical protein